MSEGSIIVQVKKKKKRARVSGRFVCSLSPYLSLELEAAQLITIRLVCGTQCPCAVLPASCSCGLRRPRPASGRDDVFAEACHHTALVASDG